MGKKVLLATVVLVPVALLLRIAFGSRSGIVEAKAIPVGELLSAIPANLRFEPRVPAAESNGWPKLVAASKSLSKVVGSDAQLLDALSRNPGGTIAAPERKRFEALFAGEQSSLQAAHEAMRARESSVGVLEDNANFVQMLRGFQLMVTLFGKRGHFRIKTGDVEGGIQDLLDAHRVGERVLGAGGPTYFTSLATSLLQRSQRDIGVAAAFPEMKEEGIARLLSALPSTDQVNAEFQRSMRCELREFTVGEVGRLKGPGANMQFPIDSPEAKRDLDTGWHEVDSIAASILDGHARPFDRKATMSSAVAIYDELAQNVERPWADQLEVRESIAKLIVDWPTIALSGAPLGHPEVQKAIAENRSTILKSENPYGKLALWFYLPVSDHSRSAPFRCRAGIEGTKISLALRLYRMKNKVFPTALNGLLEAHLLSSLPADPFSGKPFRYDPKTGKLWSVGANGRDDGGDGSAVASPLSLDIVWNVGGFDSQSATAIEVAPMPAKSSRTAPLRGFVAPNGSH